MITYNINSAKMPKIKKRGTPAWIKAMAATYRRKIEEVGYVFADDEEIPEVNNEHLGYGYYTNITTFDCNEDNIINGDTVVSLDMVRTNVERSDKPYEEEFYRTITHGILRLCGTDDKGSGEHEVMEVAEGKVLAMREQKTT